MYFQIENTPEHIRRARRVEKAPRETVKEECPRLILAPFSRPPQVVFDNVYIGSTCERILEVYNPLKLCQQITLGKAPPPGLTMHFPGKWLKVEPQTYYNLTMVWTPTQPAAVRETLRFTNESIGKFDVIIVLKTATNNKGVKGFKVSPGKRKKKVVSKKSPVAIYKKKTEIIYNTTTKIEKVVNVHSHKIHYDKENISSMNNYSIDSYHNKCPFDSPTSLDMNFNTSEIFSNLRKTNILQDTYDKSFNSNRLEVPDNILKPSNKQIDSNVSDIIDNLTFTPLKTQSKADKLDKGPRIIVSVNSESFDDSLDLSINKENETHSVISITSTQPPNKWLTVNHMENQLNETPQPQVKKHPNTSSPKEFNSPNFSINTDFSRISELSFFPQRYSTERKCFPKINETHEMVHDDFKLSSDTYTKESPNTLMENNVYQMNMERPPHYFNREQTKMCRQSLFREDQLQRETAYRNFMNPYEHNVWQSELRERSPPRSISPAPLQSIPEESLQFSDTHMFSKTDKQMTTFTINKTFEKEDRSMSQSRLTWGKKAIRGVEPELWKIPVTHPKKSLKAKKRKESIESKISNVTFESSKTDQNISINRISNVYSQSLTVDPFLSLTYFYDEGAVDEFEKEFKRWLNCILTPPADLDSDIEQKIDVGKAWIENRNKDVPLAPTKEQVSSAYHNSHRLESLRRAARNLLLSPEIATVFQKLTAQIEKKLIAIRTDRNLHLDIGLQKTIMEILLSYNPLWLRIGLEAIYGLVLPLKSNSDIEGLTTFIIQRMFKNPFLKNKHSKSNAPNILLPAYMEAIKKFTLKKFFMLVFFLDQAKQKKLISHDPCLFCRKAICKESREIIIRFTRELIAGIGDITKHLRPLGYVVCHKQSYLDEYKYAVQNLALDIRDGVRLTKVMEIILMKNGLLNQLRTPPISRLQKIHNVQVALNALKEANFVIVGDITATDIADGHREKTLSLLWQLIHVFRAPLFEKAANVIQTWWRKKYEVIVEKRREEERIRQRFNNAASIIQYWWRLIKYNRQVELQNQLVTRATVIFQKYCRMWLCRTRLQKLKTSVLKIEKWYMSIKIMRKAKQTLLQLKKERAELISRAAIKIQTIYRRWICVKQYSVTIQRIVQIQSVIRRFLARKKYLELKKTVLYIQQKYRGKLLMRCEMKHFSEIKRSVITLQSRYRSLILMRKERFAFLELKKSAIRIQRQYKAQIEMRKCRKSLLKLRNATLCVQRRYRALKSMREQKEQYHKIRSSCIKIQNAYKAYVLRKIEQHNFIKLKQATIKIQKWYRNCKKGREVKQQFHLKKQACVTIQTYYKSYVISKKQRQEYIKIKTASIYIQRYYRSYIQMKIVRNQYIQLRTSTILIQRYYRSYLETKKQRQSYLQLKAAVSSIENYYRRFKDYQNTRQSYLKLRQVVTNVQRRYRSNMAMKLQKKEYLKLKQSIIIIQRRYRALLLMREQRIRYLSYRSAVLTVQTRFRANYIMKQVRREYLIKQRASITIQRFYRACVLRSKCRHIYLKMKEASIALQRRYRALIAMREEKTKYIALRKAAICIQKRFRSYLLMLNQKQEYTKLVQACKTIQIAYRARLLGSKQREEFIKYKSAIILIQTRFRMLIQTRTIRNNYLLLKKTTIFVQRQFRANQLSRLNRRNNAAMKIQTWYRSVQKRNECRKSYLRVRKCLITFQSIIRMFIHRRRFIKLKNAALTVQMYYRSSKLAYNERRNYLHVRRLIIKVQSFVRSYIQRKRYIKLRATVLTIQAIFRLKKHKALLKQRREEAAICLQKHIRRYLIRKWYVNYLEKVVYIQRVWSGKILTRLQRWEFLHKKKMIIKLQSYARGYLTRKQVQVKKEHLLKLREEQRRHRAASKIQALFRGHRARNQIAHDIRVTELRRRWREGALQSTQESLKERNEEAMEVLRNMCDIETVIRAFRSLELLTEVFPMMYNENASSVVRRVYVYMSVTNRSISSIEVLKSAAAVLVNLTRYKITGPKIYARDRISPILKFMLRFSNSEINLFCILCTYLWLFSKYNDCREDLKQFLHMKENHKVMTTIKGHVDRMKRMSCNVRNKSITKMVSHSNSMNMSICSTTSTSTATVMPTLEPDYGIVRFDKPRYFEDAQQAINCLFLTYNL